ncbi:MAG: DUF1080 domain-containing protein [Candidatus Nealsonbacteria bacterium]|nr:DUF1080 domain-containing protein [Candidatus Nealsonbacteria bacterium]
MRLSCFVTLILLCPVVTLAEEGFVSLFDGKTHDGWQGDIKGYTIKDGVLICDPGHKIFTKKEYADFIFRFEFKLPPKGYNGVGIRAATSGVQAYNGMEIQILDDGHEVYKDLQPYQYHGSIYGVVPAKRGSLKPTGEWNCEEILCQGNHVKVTVNGTVIVDADLSKIDKTKTLDGQNHFGLHNEKGYIGLLGHGSPVEFRNIRIKELK